jgi:hypothetical protein
MPEIRKRRLDRLIDAGLDELMAGEPAMTSEAFDHAHDRLLAAMRTDNVSTGSGNETTMPVTREAPAALPRTRTRWLVAATAAVLLTAGMLAAQTLDFGGVGGGTAQASAAPVLNDAAGLAATAKDQQVGPGQYLYVSVRAEGITFQGADGDAVSRGALFVDTWIPADPRDAWLERRGELGKPTWVPGHEGSGPAPEASEGLAGEWMAPCGAFGYWAQDSKPSCDKGTWDNPTPEFLAGLPRDPKRLYKRLLADSGTETDAVIKVGGALSTGRIPAEYRALLYRAIAHAPNLRVTEQVATLDGRTGTALGIDAYGEVTDFVIDPDNGEFIGSREVLSEEEHGMAAGTVRAWSSTITAVVDTAGEEPAR